MTSKGSLDGFRPIGWYWNGEVHLFMDAMACKIYKDKDGEWRWRMRAANGEIMADSGEGYTRKADARNSLMRLLDLLGTDASALVIEEDPK